MSDYRICYWSDGGFDVEVLEGERRIARFRPEPDGVDSQVCIVDCVDDLDALLQAVRLGLRYSRTDG